MVDGLRGIQVIQTARMLAGPMAVELNRGAAPFGILIQPDPLDEKISEALGGECLIIGEMMGKGNRGDRSAPVP